MEIGLALYLFLALVWWIAALSHGASTLQAVAYSVAATLWYPVWMFFVVVSWLIVTLPILFVFSLISPSFADLWSNYQQVSIIAGSVVTAYYALILVPHRAKGIDS